MIQLIRCSSEMVEVCPEDFAVPVDITESPVEDRNSVEYRNDICDLEPVHDAQYLSEYFAVKHKQLHHDWSVFYLYGRYVTICNKFDNLTRRNKQLFTKLYRNFPLAQCYTTKWFLEVNTPVLFPGREKPQKVNFNNPVRIIDSYRRAQVQRLKDTELVLYRDSYNLRPVKIPVKKQGKKYHTLFTTYRKLFLCNPKDRVVITSFDSSVLYKKNPKWTTESLHFDSDTDSENDTDILSDSDLRVKSKEPDYDSDETFTYWDDGNMSVGSATETESELPDIKTDSPPDPVNDSVSTLPADEPQEDFTVQFKSTTVLTEQIEIKKEMDIISISQDTALKRLLEVDVSDLITDEDMKKEIKFFRELKVKEEQDCKDTVLAELDVDLQQDKVTSDI